MNTTLRNLLGFAPLLAIVLAMACQCLGADMTTAHRTTGNAPLGVHFSAIDRVTVELDTTNITGLTVGHVRNLTATGTGTLSYTQATDELTYAAPGDSAGTALDVSADVQNGIIYSDNGVDWIMVDVENASLPGTNQSDTVTIATYRSTGVVQPTATIETGVPDYAKMAYAWDFGDSSAITYSYGTLAPHDSDTEAGSPVVAHLYAEPGTYTVTLQVWNESGTKTTYTQQITVSDQTATATVYYVDATLGSDSNDGLAPTDEGGGVGPLQTWDAGMAKIAGDNVMVLYKRGEAYTTSTAKTINNDDVTISSYYNANGTDDTAQARPTITVSGATGLLAPGSGVDDVKICNLDMAGGGATSGVFCNCTAGTTPHTNTTLYNCEVQTCEGMYTGDVTARFFNKHAFLVNCYAHDIGSGDEIPPATGGGNAIFSEVSEGAILGCLIEDIILDGEHCIRIQFHEEGVIAHNTSRRANAGKGALTLRGTVFGWDNAIGEVHHTPHSYTAVLYNVLDAREAGGQAFGISAAIEDADVRHEHVLVHGNFIAHSQTSGWLVDPEGKYTTMRRNVFKTNANGLDYSSFLQVCPTHMRIVGNTFDVGTTYAPLLVSGLDGSTNLDPKDTTFSSNLVYQADKMWAVAETDMGEFAADYNIGDTLDTTWGTVNPDAAGATNYTLASTQSTFSIEANSSEGTASLANPSGDDYQITASSDAVDASDSSLLSILRIDANGREVTGTPDVGAFEYSATDPFARQTFIPGVLIRQP